MTTYQDLNILAEMFMFLRDRMLHTYNTQRAIHKGQKDYYPHDIRRILLDY